MTAQKMLLEVIGEIDEDLIIQATTLHYSRTKCYSTHWKWAIIAAVILVSMAIGFVSNKKQRVLRRENAESSMWKSDTHTGVSASYYSSETTNHMFDMQSVLIYPNDANDISDEFEPGPGEINISLYLSEHILSDEYRDKYFSVSIKVIHFDFIEDYRKSVHDNYLKTLQDPILLKYEEDYEKWIQNVIKPALSKEERETFEDKWYHTEESYKQFDTYWKENQPADVWESYLEAKETSQKAWNEYLEYINHEEEILLVKFGKDIEEAMEVELQRLKSNGYILYISPDNGTVLCGYLTGEQLRSFKCSPEYGYYIIWNGQEEVMDE